LLFISLTHSISLHHANLEFLACLDLEASPPRDLQVMENAFSIKPCHAGIFHMLSAVAAGGVTRNKECSVNILQQATGLPARHPAWLQTERRSMKPGSWCGT